MKSATIVQLKTAHSRSPKEWLDETMTDFSGGTWLILEGKTEELGQIVVCIGYKLKKSTNICFNKRSGSSEAGNSYKVRFPDKYSILCVRHVACTEVISNYCKYSNKGDVHNQVWQFDIALEKKWVTPFPYFRLYRH